MKTQQNNGKSGLYAIGLIKNIQTCLDELKQIIKEEDASLTWAQLNELVENAEKEYFNASGYVKFPDGKPVTLGDAKYVRFLLRNLMTPDDHEVYGWFSRANYNERTPFIGVTWGTKTDFASMIKKSSYFTIGDLVFEKYQDGLEFLEDIASNTITESWKYKNHSSKINHPILKSYIENIIIRLKYEHNNGQSNRFMYSRDRKYVMFNINLLDKFFHDVIIVGRVLNENGDTKIVNPSRSTSTKKLLDIGFDREKPLPPQFFEDVNDVIFRPTWKVDDDFDAYNHIVEERQSRFPDEYENEEPEALARKLDDAIKYAIAMAQRNYKFIVPMYRPKENRIQLLMPIYLKGTYSKKPDFALVLTPDNENKLYIPETILPLDAAYQNARLIAKPDEAWLNPDEL